MSNRQAEVAAALDLEPPFTDQAALQFIRANLEDTVNIASSVHALGEQVSHLQQLTDARRDLVVGNIKARIRMVAQFAIDNANNGLVIGTDHAAETVMGFVTKFGDGTCDLAPLSGLVKGQVRAIARHLGAPEHLEMKTPTADLEELRPGKPDEEAHDVSHAKIDVYLHGQPLNEHAYASIVRTYDNTRHKRELPLAPCAVSAEAYIEPLLGTAHPTRRNTG
ncbi:MAG: NAD(+) synthase [Pseudomonas sp.]|nr:NAD(+) synthase [Pseudomonas sp.]MDP3814057.1 NAD(+) synthase [Pseudomonas sp.]